MTSTCPYGHISYATWRLRTLRSLYTRAKTNPEVQLPFLYPRAIQLRPGDGRQFHESRSRTRKQIKDLKRTAKYKSVQLELEKHVNPGSDPNASSSDKRRRQASEWNPYSKENLEDLEGLVGDLRAMTIEAAAKEGDGKQEEGIPFEDRVFRRQRPSQPQSPLERALPWDRPTKLQIHEVDVDKKLENNMWAQMLASPLRMDRSTKARLPRDLMLTWGVMKSPRDQKDYFMPIELSDTEALEEELRQNSLAETSSITSETKEPGDPLAIRTNWSPRITMASNKLATEALTDSFLYDKRNRAGEKVSVATNSGTLKTGLVPFRWRYKQDELKAFAKTRERFNESLNRQPDEDEPNLNDMSDLDNLQWQPDIADRMERIMRTRVLMVLEAIGKRNTSGRAIHSRKVVAMSIPENGLLTVKDDGKSHEVEPQNFKNDVESPVQNTGAREHSSPEWVHGAIALHIGKPEAFHRTIEQWHQHAKLQHQSDSRALHELPSYDLIPPMLTINKHFRIPIFNLETLLGEDSATKIQEIINANAVLTRKFWEQYETNPRDTLASAGFQANIDNSRPASASPIPHSPLEAGEQVLSSILTPDTDTGPPQSDTTLTSATATPPSDPAPDTEDPYVILIKPKAHHAPLLIREIWLIWQYIGGRSGLYFGPAGTSTD